MFEIPIEVCCTARRYKISFIGSANAILHSSSPIKITAPTMQIVLSIKADYNLKYYVIDIN